MSNKDNKEILKSNDDIFESDSSLRVVNKEKKQPPSPYETRSLRFFQENDNRKEQINASVSEQIKVKLYRNPDNGTYTVEDISGRPPTNVSSVQGAHSVPYKEFTTQVKKIIDGKSASAALEGMLLLINTLEDLEGQHVIYRRVIQEVHPFSVCERVYPYQPADISYREQSYINYDANEEIIMGNVEFLIKAYLSYRNKETGAAFFMPASAGTKQIDRQSFSKLIKLGEEISGTSEREEISNKICDKIVNIMDGHLDYPVTRVITEKERKTTPLKGKANRNPKTSDLRDNSAKGLARAIARQIHSVLVYCDVVSSQVHYIEQKFVEKILLKEDKAWLQNLKNEKEYIDKSENEILLSIKEQVHSELPGWLKAIDSFSSDSENRSSSMELSSFEDDGSDKTSDSDLEDGRMGGYAQYIMTNLGIPSVNEKKAGFYFYRHGNPQKIYVMVIYEKSEGNEHVCLTDIPNMEERIAEINWETDEKRKEMIAAVLPKGLIHLIKTKCKNQDEFIEAVKEEIFDDLDISNMVRTEVVSNTNDDSLSSLPDKSVFDEIKKRLTNRQDIPKKDLDVYFHQLDNMFNTISNKEIHRAEEIEENISYSPH